MNINDINKIDFSNFNINELEGFDTSTSLSQSWDDYDQTIERLAAEYADRLKTILQLSHRDDMVVEKRTGKVGKFRICRYDDAGWSYLGFVPNKKDGSAGKRVTCKVDPWCSTDEYIVRVLVEEFGVVGEDKEPDSEKEIILAELAKVDTSRTFEQLHDELRQAKPNRVRKYNARVQYILEFFHVGAVIDNNSGKRGLLRFTERDEYHVGYIAFYPYNKDGSVSKTYDSSVCRPYWPNSDVDLIWHLHWYTAVTE